MDKTLWVNIPRLAVRMGNLSYAAGYMRYGIASELLNRGMRLGRLQELAGYS